MKRHRYKLRTGNEGWLTSYADLMTNLLVFFLLIVSASEIQTGRLENLMSRLGGHPTGSLTEAKKTVDQAIEDQHLKNQVEARLTNAGLEISFNSGVTFSSGRAEIRPEMLSPMTKVLQPLVPLASKYRYAVEGHTDDVPISKATSNYRSNWDLSSARALEVRESLERMGVPPTSIRVEAYADTKPLPATELAGLSVDEARSRHRRVVIRLY